MNAQLVPVQALDRDVGSRVVAFGAEDGSGQTARLRTRLEEALASRPRRLVVDLGACGHVDASALSVLLEAHRASRRQGGELVLRAVSPRVERLLALTGVTGVFCTEAG